MRLPPRTVARLALALLGWIALASTVLPPGNPLRIALTGGFLVLGPGAAALLARPTIARTAGGPDRLAAASLAVALSTALAALTAVALLAYDVFSVERALAALAAVTTLLALVPHGTRPGRGGRPPGGAPPVRTAGPAQDAAPRRGPWRPGRARRVAGALAAATLLALGAACSGTPGTPGAAGSNAAAGARLPAAAAANRPPAAGSWRLVFHDEFTGSTLDPAKWTTCYDWNDGGCTNAGNGEDQWYQPGQVKAGGGRLTLTAQPRTVTGSDGRTYPWVSGMVSTGRDSWNAQPRHTFTYGYFAASIKVPANPHGFFPAFWLIPAATRGTPPEVDIAEFPNTDQYVHMNLHWRGPDGSDQHVGQNWGPADFSSDFHVFGVDWEPSTVTWYVDGKAWFQVTDPSRIPNVAMEVVLNLAVGYLESPPVGTDSAALQAQWVQVWQH
ncbi:family 16 glycosylhydrolase [Kitasatospora sp. NPDC058218]|uniref:glycoside hydrolase family 16 protein n=1 Tax=Kitasatospora sp. NPDC058218 TaxID=3346385 RepID=UPI0036DC677A